MADIVITCLQCKNPFTHTQNDQDYYATKTPPWTPPKRCKSCRDENKRKAAEQGNQPAARPAPEVSVWDDSKKPQRPQKGRDRRQSGGGGGRGGGY